MSETDPLVSALAGLVVDIVWWLDSCSDDDVDPDSAVKMLESVAGVVGDLPDDQQLRLIRVLGELADAETRPGRREQLRQFPFACGLVDEPFDDDGARGISGNERPTGPGHEGNSMTTRPTRGPWVTHAETAADIPVIRDVVTAAFPTPAEADLVDALRADRGAWLDGLSVVSTDPDGHVAGYALLTRCHIGDTPALCLAPCAVRPDVQRRGAGSAAVRAALDSARRQGEQFVVVLGHAEYYPRFGFTRASLHGIRLSIDVPDEALMALSLTGATLPRGTVRYAAPFGI